MSQTITLEDIYAPVAPGLAKVPQAILDILSGSNDLIEDVVRYFFSSQGKLLRPALTFLGGSLKNLPNSDERLLHLAAGFEVFHSATLVHDDIIDSSYLRRNLPTVHVKWNPQVAVLVGDFLHDKAIGSIYEKGNPDVFRLFLETAGAVCDGEVHELKETGNVNLDEATYFDIIYKKTASLMACALASGALLGGASEKEAEALKLFGRYFGMAFQIVDDCLDFTGNENEFGKTLGKDCIGGVMTLPLIRLISISDEAQKKNIIKSVTEDSNEEKLQAVLALIHEFGTIDYSRKVALDFSSRAREQLNVFASSPAKQSLSKLLDYVLERNR